MSLRSGMISVISLNPFRIVLRRFCSDAMWFARFSSSVNSSLYGLRFVVGVVEEEPLGVDEDPAASDAYSSDTDAFSRLSSFLRFECEFDRDEVDDEDRA